MNHKKNVYGEIPKAGLIDKAIIVSCIWERRHVKGREKRAIAITLDAEVDLGEILEEVVPVICDGRVPYVVVRQVGRQDHQSRRQRSEEDEEKNERRTRNHEQLQVIYSCPKHVSWNEN